MPAILSITIAAKSAGAQGSTWAVSSFSGTATLNVSPPADGVCHGDTGQLTVRSK